MTCRRIAALKTVEDFRAPRRRAGRDAPFDDPARSTPGRAQAPTAPSREHYELLAALKTTEDFRAHVAAPGVTPPSTRRCSGRRRFLITQAFRYSMWKLST
jgi:hypothetical protein